jgi:hypothetical protein
MRAARAPFAERPGADAVRERAEPKDILWVVAGIVGLALFFGFQAASRGPAGYVGPITVDDAIGLEADSPLAVVGYVVRGEEGTLLCQRRSCEGAQLVILGDSHRAPTGWSLVLGTVYTGGIELRRIDGTRHAGSA